MKSRIGILVALLVAGLVAAAQAGPTIHSDMVGNYQGTVSYKSYNYQTGLTTTGKDLLQISLGDKDEFTITQAGQSFGSGTGTFGAENGILAVLVPQGGFTFTLHYKNGKLKGLATVHSTDPNAFFSEGKFTTTKVAP